MKNFVLIIVRLLLMAGFFAGLFMAIRMQAWWHFPVGALLMLTTPTLNNLVIAAGRGEKTGLGRLASESRGMTQVILPIVLFIAIIVGIFQVARLASPQYFFLYLYAGIPLVMVVIRAIYGELPWSAGPLITAFTRLVTFQVSYLALILGTVFLTLVVGVMGTVMLLITLGNLAWQWFSQPDKPLSPFFCGEFNLGSGLECGLTLAGLHLLQLLILFVMVKYGDKIFDVAADWVNSYRDE